MANLWPLTTRTMGTCWVTRRTSQSAVTPSLLLSLLLALSLLLSLSAFLSCFLWIFCSLSCPLSCSLAFYCSFDLSFALFLDLSLAVALARCVSPHCFAAGDELFAIDRTVSRLMEMQSREYLLKASAHALADSTPVATLTQRYELSETDVLQELVLTLY